MKIEIELLPAEGKAIEKYVSALIGSNGSTISYIREQSGAYVSIEGNGTKKNDNEPTKVVISSKMEEKIQAARRLVDKMVNLMDVRDHITLDEFKQKMQSETSDEPTNDNHSVQLETSDEPTNDNHSVQLETSDQPTNDNHCSTHQLSVSSKVKKRLHGEVDLSSSKRSKITQPETAKQTDNGQPVFTASSLENLQQSHENTDENVLAQNSKDLDAYALNGFEVRELKLPTDCIYLKKVISLRCLNPVSEDLKVIGPENLLSIEDESFRDLLKDSFESSKSCLEQIIKSHRFFARVWPKVCERSVNFTIYSAYVLFTEEADQILPQEKRIKNIEYAGISHNPRERFYNHLNDRSSQFYGRNDIKMMVILSFHSENSIEAFMHAARAEFVLHTLVGGFSQKFASQPGVSGSNSIDAMNVNTVSRKFTAAVITNLFDAMKNGRPVVPDSKTGDCEHGVNIIEFSFPTGTESFSRKISPKGVIVGRTKHLRQLINESLTNKKAVSLNKLSIGPKKDEQLLDGSKKTASLNKLSIGPKNNEQLSEDSMFESTTQKPTNGLLNESKKAISLKKSSGEPKKSEQLLDEPDFDVPKDRIIQGSPHPIVNYVGRLTKDIVREILSKYASGGEVRKYFSEIGRKDPRCSACGKPYDPCLRYPRICEKVECQKEVCPFCFLCRKVQKGGVKCRNCQLSGVIKKAVVLDSDSDSSVEVLESDNDSSVEILEPGNDSSETD
ncbi:hypothetical protein M3Y97_00246100 [Aphelenchoides bicaudatus]|nr:hypothetical protein M3Y97_00246100 [Aphelenchoides bicaudatus]